MFQQLIAPAVSFGVSAAVIPGPLIAFLVNTTLTQGWRRALLVVLSPLITDAPVIVLMTFILGQMPPNALKLIQLSGGCLLLFIACGALKQFRYGVAIDLKAKDDKTVDSSWQRVLMTGVMMNFLSPGPWLFWSAINGPLLLIALQQSAVHALAFLLAFYCTFLGGLCAWALLFHYARRVHAKYLRYVILATALLLIWFAIGLIASALG